MDREKKKKNKVEEEQKLRKQVREYLDEHRGEHDLSKEEEENVYLVVKAEQNKKKQARKGESRMVYITS